MAADGKHTHPGGIGSMLGVRLAYVGLTAPLVGAVAWAPGRQRSAARRTILAFGTTVAVWAVWQLAMDGRGLLDAAGVQLAEHVGHQSNTILDDTDRLGRLKLTREGLAERDRRVLRALHERRIPVALSMAGGYGRVIEDTVAIQLQTMRAALHSWRQWNNTQHDRSRPTRSP